MPAPNLSTSFQTTVAAGSFFVQSEGYIQGHLLDNPVDILRIAGGVLASTETMPMWGGVGIYEDIPTPGSTSLPADQLGSIVGRALSISSTSPLRGFSVFNQAHAMLTSPQSEAPAAPAGGNVEFVRLGSGVRLAVACDPALISLEGGDISQQVSWDFINQRLVPYVASYAQTSISGATWATTGGGQVTFTTASATGIAVGDDFNVSGMAPAGYNGAFTAITGTTGATLIAALSTNPGTETALGNVLAGGGAVPVKVLGFSPVGGGFTITYDSVNNYCHYVRTGTCAIILV